MKIFHFFTCFCPHLVPKNETMSTDIQPNCAIPSPKNGSKPIDEIKANPYFLFPHEALQKKVSRNLMNIFHFVPKFVPKFFQTYPGWTNTKTKQKDVTTMKVSHQATSRIAQHVTAYAEHKDPKRLTAEIHRTIAAVSKGMQKKEKHLSADAVCVELKSLLKAQQNKENALPSRSFSRDVRILRGDWIITVFNLSSGNAETMKTVEKALTETAFLLLIQAIRNQHKAKLNKLLTQWKKDTLANPVWNHADTEGDVTLREAVTNHQFGAYCQAIEADMVYPSYAWTEKGVARFNAVRGGLSFTAFTITYGFHKNGQPRISFEITM